MAKITLKLLSIFYFILIFTEAIKTEADTKVELDLKAVVDPELNIERIDNNGSIDLFSRKKSEYRVTSNIDKNVKVTINSINGWKVKLEDPKSGNEKKETENSDEIEYYAEFESSGRTEKLDKNKDSTIIDNSVFKDNCCEFSLTFCAENPFSKKKSGTYGDTITVNVEAQ